MRLRELISELSAASVDGPVETEVSGIAYDSRRVNPGNVFVAISGPNNDGHDYIDAAVYRGAAAVICERPGLCTRRTTRIRVEDGREALALAAARYYEHPSARLKVIGVSGTRGATAVSFIVQAILEAAGISTGLIGSVHYQVGHRRIPAQRSRPESLDVQQMMSHMVRAGCEACVVEVNSAGLDPQRVMGVQFDVGIVTTIGPEPVDCLADFNRPSFAALESERKRGAEVLNIVNAFGARLPGRAQVEVELSDGPGQRARLRATNIQLGPTGSRFVVEGEGQPRFAVRIPLVGRQHLHHALAAIASGLWMKIPPVVLQGALNGLPPVPGRLEPVESGQPFSVLVDEACGEESLRQVLNSVGEITPGRVLLLCGCGGERDAGQRARVGQVAAEGAGVTLITSNNPRRESRIRIAEQIEQGYHTVRTGGCLIELDRQAAIGQLVDMARPGDTVLLTGKGHNAFEELEDTVIPFDDRFHAQAALELLGYGQRAWNLAR